MPGKKGAQKAAKIGGRKGKASKAIFKKGEEKKSKKEAPKQSKAEPEDLEKDLAAQKASLEATVKRKTKANRLNEAQQNETERVEPKGVVYLGHLPVGFYEPQMKKFFNQFGRVTRLKLTRSKKNAASKGYAFLEFEEESVAKIVAETMNKYLLFGRVLVAHLVPKEKLTPGIFRGTGRRFINLKPKRLRKARSDYNDRPTVEVNGGLQVAQTTETQERRRSKQSRKIKDKLAKFGIDFDFEAALAGGADEADEEDAPKAKAAAGTKRKASAKTAATTGADESAAKKRRK